MRRRYHCRKPWIQWVGCMRGPWSYTAKAHVNRPLVRWTILFAGYVSREARLCIGSIIILTTVQHHNCWRVYLFCNSQVHFRWPPICGDRAAWVLGFRLGTTWSSIINIIHIYIECKCIVFLWEVSQGSSLTLSLVHGLALQLVYSRRPYI